MFWLPFLPPPTLFRPAEKEKERRDPDTEYAEHHPSIQLSSHGTPAGSLYEDRQEYSGNAPCAYRTEGGEQRGIITPRCWTFLYDAS